MKKSTNASGGNWVAIVAMFFLFAMISFVTNLAAPLGTIWKNNYEWSGMLGNLMNFAAYLFMGIPAGNLLMKIGYKKTALYAMVVGLVGLVLQWLSGFVGTETGVFTVAEQVVTLNFIIYLLGAFICGFCVCMLNTVVNPMLNLLGGGGNHGNQLVQMGGSFNSLAGTLTPFAVGALVGVITKKTTLLSVAPLLWIAMGVFIFAFIVISFVAIPEPHKNNGSSKKKYSHSPWSFRHTVLGVIGIFFYVGIEVGIPGILIFYLQDLTGSLAVGTAVASFYWLLMLVGRFCSSLISGVVSSRAQLITVSSVAIVLIAVAIIMPQNKGMEAPTFLYNPEESTRDMLVSNDVPAEQIDAIMAIENPTAESYAEYSATLEAAGINAQELASARNTPVIPYSSLLLVLCGLCTSVMWGGIFNLAVEGLGKYTAQASGIFMMMVVGGGVMPLIQEAIGRSAGFMTSYWLVIAMLAYLFFYAVVGSKNVNTEIPVDETDAPDLRDL